MYPKLVILFLISLSLSACTSKLVQKDTPVEPIKTSADYLKNIVTILSSDDLKGRKTGSEGIEKAAVFIEKELASYKKTGDINIYRETFKVKDQETSNILSFIPGNDPKLKEEVIIVGAHYDHIGENKTDNLDTIANGANDNAAGVSAALAIAKHFSHTRSNKRSILIALFSAEELGLLGAKYFADSLLAQDIQVYCMINFEMIGIPMQNREYQAYVTGFSGSNMAKVINQHSGMNLLGFLPQAQEYNLFKRSDNYPVFNKLQVPAQTISTFDFTNYDYYHDVEDESEKLDYQHMANLINNLMPAIEKISQSQTQEIKLTPEN